MHVKTRKYSRLIHIYLSLFFSILIIGYALSGLVLNHRRDFNPDYKISNIDTTIPGIFPLSEKPKLTTIKEWIKQIDQKAKYTKHYFYNDRTLKIFLKQNSSMQIDLNNGAVFYEKLERRHVFYHLNNLHLNRNKFWTYFADFFAISLILITISGILMIKPKILLRKYLIIILIGLAIPLIFIFI